MNGLGIYKTNSPIHPARVPTYLMMCEQQIRGKSSLLLLAFDCACGSSLPERINISLLVMWSSPGDVNEAENRGPLSSGEVACCWECSAPSEKVPIQLSRRAVHMVMCVHCKCNATRHGSWLTKSTLKKETLLSMQTGLGVLSRGSFTKVRIGTLPTS